MNRKAQNKYQLRHKSSIIAGVFLQSIKATFIQ